MIKRLPKFMTGLILGLLAIALVAGFAVVTLGQTSGTASAAGLNQTSTGSSTTVTTTVTPGAKQNAKAQYRQQFLNSFTSQLGVSQDKLNTAYTAAVDSTVDQAVKDGKLTQDQATKIKARAQKGFTTNFLNHKGDHAKDHKRAFALKSELKVAATTLNLTPAQLKAELKTGKSVSDVAQEHNVPLQNVKTAILNDVKTKLATAVSNHKLTQTRADQINSKVASKIDQFLSKKFGTHKQTSTTSTSK